VDQSEEMREEHKAADNQKYEEEMTWLSNYKSPLSKAMWYSLGMRRE